MEVTRMKVNRFHLYKGSELENRALLKRLSSHVVTDAHWTEHARQRAQEMVDAGFRFDHMLKAIRKPSSTYWSPTYQQPCAKFGKVAVGFMADKWGRAIVVTVLPASDEAWQQFYAVGEAEDRARRVDSVAEKMPVDNDDAVALMMDDPFKMEFFLYNKNEIAELLESDPGAKRSFLVAAERAVHSASHRDQRDRMEADINMHPHLTAAERRHLLMVLHQYGKSVKASSAGLPTLGKRR